MARSKSRSTRIGPFVSGAGVTRLPPTTVTRSTESGASRPLSSSPGGYDGNGSPAAAKVLCAAEELREIVSKDWK